MSRVNELAKDVTAGRQEFRRIQDALNKNEVLDGFDDLPAMDAELLRMDAELKPKEENYNRMAAIENRETSAVLPNGVEVPSEGQMQEEAERSLYEYNRSIGDALGIAVTEPEALFADQFLNHENIKPYHRINQGSLPVMVNGLLDEWLPAKTNIYNRAVTEGTGVQGVTATGTERMQGAVPWDGYTPAARDIRGMLSVIPRRPFTVGTFHFSVQTEKVTAAQRAEGVKAAEGTFRANRHTVDLKRTSARVLVSEDALNTPEVEAILREDSMYANLDQLNQQLIQGDGTGTNVTGFSSPRAAATNRLYQIGFASGTNRVNDALQERILWTSINAAERAIMFTGDAMITHAVVHPEIFFTTRAEWNAQVGWVWSNPADPLQMRAWGTPLIPSSGFAASGADVPAIICGDFTRYAMLATMGDVEIEFGYEDDGFGTYTKTIRSGFRNDLVLKRTSAFYIIPWSGS